MPVGRRGLKRIVFHAHVPSNFDEMDDTRIVLTHCSGGAQGWPGEVHGILCG